MYTEYLFQFPFVTQCIIIFSPAVIVIIVLFILHHMVYRKQARDNEGKTLPPGPKPFPIIGNLHQMGVLPHLPLKEMADKYGDIMYLRMGSVPWVVVSSSTAAKLFLKTYDSIFASRPLNPIGGGILFNSIGLVFAPYGSHWRNTRKTCVFHLLNAKKEESLSSIQAREEEVSSMAMFLWKESNEGMTAVNMTKAFAKLTCDFSLRFITGKKLDASEEERTIRMELENVLDEISQLINSVTLSDCFPALAAFDLQGMKRWEWRIKKKLDLLFDKILDGHREREGESDLVDVMLNMLHDHPEHVSMETVKTVMLEVYIAATDTTSTALVWAMAELVKHPKIMKKLQSDMQSKEGMKYLDCVIKETLRLHPPFTLGPPHAAVEDATVGGYFIPKNTRIMFNFWAISRNPETWEHHDEFMPERFMNESEDNEEEKLDMTGQLDFKMIPFGGGRRICPGYDLALRLIKGTLIKLLSQFNWAVEDNDPSSIDLEELCALTIMKKNPLYLTPKLRCKNSSS